MARTLPCWRSDMDNVELRGNAMLAELKSHINGLVDRCAALAAENAVLKLRISELDNAPIATESLKACDVAA